MSLRTLLPSLANNVHQALEVAGITAQDILFSQDTQIHQQLPAGTLSIRELAELKAQVAKQASAPVARGDELFNREEERETARESCLCGVNELDALLGGFGKHGVIEIAGDKGSGKTGLVLQVVLRHLALYRDHTVSWIDIGGEFAVERAAKILQLNPGPGSDTALDRLGITLCFDVAEVHRALEDLRIALTAERQGPLRTRFLVVDPLTPLFAPILSNTSSQGHAIMTMFMRQMGSLARIYSFTALFIHVRIREPMMQGRLANRTTSTGSGGNATPGFVTNTSVQSQPQNPHSAFPTTTTKPALGPSFPFLTDDTLWLSSAQKVLPVGHEAETMGAKAFIAEVFRSHSTLSGTWCAFVIQNGVTFEQLVSPDISQIQVTGQSTS